jgi:TolB-like protein
LRYLFEDFEFDTDRRELHRGTDLVSIEPLVFDLLDYLIRNRERVVSKDDLINTIWSGRSVSDAALTTRLNAVRSAIGDSGEKQRLIKTLPRKGFRFVGTVQEAQRRTVEPPGSAAHGGGTTLASAPRLSIVVLPFMNLSGDTEQDYFVDGVTENLTTDLSRVSGSFVIGRHTAFTYKSKSVDLKKIGRELNIRYVLEGSVQRGGDRLRVNVRLVDAETGNHLWAERFDKPIADLLDMQDEIVSRLSNTLGARLIEAEARQAERSLHPNTMDLYFQGMACLNRGGTPEYMTQARGFFEQALALDPGSVEALVGKAIVDFSSGAYFSIDDRFASLAAAEAALIKSLYMAPQNARAHMYLGGVHIFKARAAQGIAECELALALDRNLADAHGWIGLAKCYLGRGEETEVHIGEAFRLSPRDIFAYRWMTFVGIAKLWQGADAESVVWLRRGLEANRNFPIGHFMLAAGLALLGHLYQAQAAAKAGLALDPNFTIRRYRVGTPSNNPIYLAGRERFYQGMRMAGVPEG